MVTQMLRQGDAEVFKLHSQAKLGMMREALAKLDRQANDRRVSSTRIDFMHIFEHNQSAVEHPASQELLMVKGLTGRAAGI